MSVLATVSAPPLAANGAGCVVLHGVSWEVYQALRQPEENNHLRMTYDRGDLEIMSPQRKHGKIVSLLALMIYEWTRRHRIKIESGGNMTCDRADLERGLEPDLCYWIAQQAAVRGKDRIDLLVDPPPDLALEVDVSRSAIPKLPIYESLRIPEVWRWGAGLEVLKVGKDLHYSVRTTSSALPGFPVSIAEDFLRQRDLEDETTLMERFEKAIAGSSPSRS